MQSPSRPVSSAPPCPHPALSDYPLNELETLARALRFPFCILSPCKHLRAELWFQQCGSDAQTCLSSSLLSASLYAQLPTDISTGMALDRHLKPIPLSPLPSLLLHPSEWHLQFPTENWVSVLPPTRPSPPTSSSAPQRTFQGPTPCCFLPGPGHSLLFLKLLQ